MHPIIDYVFAAVSIVFLIEVCIIFLLAIKFILKEMED